MRTAQEMYYFAKQNGFGKGFTENLALKHFGIIEKNLQPDEDVKMVFIGLHNYKSVTKHDNNFAYAVTQKRIIMAQKRVIGTVCQSVYLNQLNDITLSTGLALGVVTIDTTKERFNVGVAKEHANNIYGILHQTIDEIRNPVQAAQAKQQANMNSDMSALQYFKQMYDDGLITAEEYEFKRRQILGI